MMEDSLFVYRSMYVEHINRRARGTATRGTGGGHRH